MMIIDFHSHPDWHKHDLKKFLANMDQFHIDQSVLLSWECPKDEYDPGFNAATAASDGVGPIPFSRCLSYVERAPERFILGYAPDPRRPEAIDQMSAAMDIYGVKVFGEMKVRMMYDNLDALRMYRFCGQRGVPVLVHLDYEFETTRKYPRPSYWYGGGIEALERAVATCPQTVFIGHAPGFWAHISGDGQQTKASYPKGPIVPGGKLPEMLRTYPNLYCDISAGSGHNALSRDLEFTKDFLAEFQDRILYGRDFFDNAHQQLLNSLGLSQPTLDKIYSGNALRLLSAVS